MAYSNQPKVDGWFEFKSDRAGSNGIRFSDPFDLLNGLRLSNEDERVFLMKLRVILEEYRALRLVEDDWNRTGNCYSSSEVGRSEFRRMLDEPDFAGIMKAKENTGNISPTLTKSLENDQEINASIQGLVLFSSGQSKRGRFCGPDPEFAGLVTQFLRYAGIL